MAEGGQVTLDARDGRKEGRANPQEQQGKLGTPFLIFFQHAKSNAHTSARCCQLTPSGAGPQVGAHKNPRGLGTVGVQGRRGGWVERSSGAGKGGERREMQRVGTGEGGSEALPQPPPHLLHDCPPSSESAARGKGRLEATGTRGVRARSPSRPRAKGRKGARPTGLPGFPGFPGSES